MPIASQISIQNIIRTLFLFIFLSGSTLFAVLGQSTRDSQDFSTADRFVAGSSFFTLQENYMPGQVLNSLEKTIYVAINVWQKDDGSGNFHESEEFYHHMQELVHRLNSLFSRSIPPSHPIEGVEYLHDSHIRFALKEVSFYQNSSLHRVSCGAGGRLNQTVFQMHPQKQQYLNIHFVKGNCRGASGYANYPNVHNLQDDSFIVSYMRDQQEPLDDYPFWALMLHIAHELGHNMDLLHPYDSEYCRFSHPDFLFDLFGFEKQHWCTNIRQGCDVCYHQGGWNCDTNDPGTTCTNNLMGGNKDARSITPLQMGRMNRSLALASVRKYAWGYSDKPYRINQNENWNVDVKFYQDIVISTGDTLIISSTLEMVPQAKIILEPGATLIIDGGRITNALYSNTMWQGLEILPAQKRGFAFWRRIVPAGEVILKNDGTLENSIY